jgi:hypothetical protein
MLDYSSCAPADCLAQTSWTKYGNGTGGGTRYTFFGFTPPGGYAEWDTSPYPINQNTTYQITYGWDSYCNCNKAYQYINGTQVASSQVDFGPNDAQMQGEIGNIASQMAGGYNSPEYFNSPQYKDSTHSTWTTWTGTAGSSNVNNYYSGWLTGALEIYDWACAT